MSADIKASLRVMDEDDPCTELPKRKNANSTSVRGSLDKPSIRESEGRDDLEPVGGHVRTNGRRRGGGPL
jgi:hypothetical protein